MKRWIAALVCLVLTACGSEPPSDLKVLYGKDGQPLPDSQVNSANVNWRLMSTRDADADIFRAVGSWQGSCSATLIAPPEFDPEAQGDLGAYVLTNGHCIRFDKDAVVINASLRGTLTLNMYQDARSEDRLRAPGRLIVYSTMRSTDTALLQLQTTYRQLASQGYRPIRLTAQAPAVGTQVRSVSIPQSGVISSQRFVRTSTCQLGERVALEEGGFRFPQAIRNNCSVIGGSSGSGLFAQDAAGEWRLVALINTGTSYQSSRPDCSVNAPCEVDPDSGKKKSELFNYAQDVYQLARCFDAKGAFQLNATCDLPKP